MSTQLDLLSAGAAQGLVAALRETFAAATRADVHGTFGAVGTIREKLDAGTHCDVVILTAAMLDALAREGRVQPDTIAPLGRVRTGIAVRDGDPLPDIGTPAALGAAFRAARAIYVPDTERATAGIHFVDVLRRLGIHDEVVPRLAVHPNGATAMRELAHASGSGHIGCTQITEIRNTEGVALVGPLPLEFELATVYSAAVHVDARDPVIARRFVEMLSGVASQPLRRDCGFE